MYKLFDAQIVSVPDQKQKILEKLTASLLFERNRRFAFVHGNKEDYKEYLLRKADKEGKRTGVIAGEKENE